jgi:hypothetical protein
MLYPRYNLEGVARFPSLQVLECAFYTENSTPYLDLRRNEEEEIEVDLVLVEHESLVDMLYDKYGRRILYDNVIGLTFIVTISGTISLSKDPRFSHLISDLKYLRIFSLMDEFSRRVPLN